MYKKEIIPRISFGKQKKAYNYKKIFAQIKFFSKNK